ncbi:MAG TPA: hypothetical protein VKU03_14975 [Roseiarcus sp.]|nr:hypothetical protein [Roseiarcus sp.]
MSDWQAFFSAQVSASAALLGLLFVSISINLGKILSFRSLPNRAFGALLILLVVLIVSSLLLAPGQARAAIGGEVLVIGLFAWAAITASDVKMWKNTDRAAAYHRRLIPIAAINQLAALLYFVAGAVILTRGMIGVYWLVPAFLFSFAKAAMDAWVLLIEINR